MVEASRTVTHNEVVTSMVASYSRVDQQEVADCFPASLSTRRLDLRSTLGSFVIARHVVDVALRKDSWRRGSPRPTGGRSTGWLSREAGPVRRAGCGR